MILAVKYLTKITLLVWLLLVVSCNSRIYDPNYQHQLFLESLNDHIGKHYSGIRNISGMVSDRTLLGSSTIDNGNIVFSHGNDRCGYKFEVNPDSGIIVGARIDPEKSECHHIP